MISVSDLELVAQNRFADAECLLEKDRFDGAVYLGGYALEMAFKVKLCKISGLSDFPENRSELKNLNNQTKHWFHHNLAKLEGHSGLNLSSPQYITEWSVVKQWDVEMRYKRSNVTQQSANDFLDSVKILLPAII